MMAENDIVEGCKHGRREAQRALYDHYAPGLMATAMRYMGSRDNAQDVLQEALIKAFQSIERFAWQGNGSLHAWLDRIVINTAVSMLRKSLPQTAILSLDELPDNFIEPDSAEVSQIDAHIILEMVASLPAGYRTIFNLYCIDGFSHRDIARQLGISEGTSSSQLSRARAILARKVQDYLKHHAQ
ncbi:MAG: sigma-70 family RNA polymerase sigma factor [Muribaculaceae bacterium]|nr:sigma-70 family RNA polymerase sigma factor [Muribaculaceae bacterium]